ncbi:hypothetical protein DMN91_004699 [Ooceraea biroi]|uniref:Uncharacterized protein n=1 Tax=Ooceraea biroi TaxID=2015173 RepID=A0A3L8DPY2_OOCBI|nr:hypothetical protein DMN91_004699 [Ooceraea biroi]
MMLVAQFGDTKDSQLVFSVLLREVLCPLLEPIGSKAPAFAGDAKLSLLVRRANMDVSLPCNAQGHPPPVSSNSLLARGSPVSALHCQTKIGFEIMASRYSLEPVGSKAPAFAGEAKISLLARKANAEISLPCNAQGHPAPVSRGSQFPRIEPVATKKPKFSSDAKFAGYDRVRGEDLTLLCPAQGFPVPAYRTSRHEEAQVLERREAGLVPPRSRGEPDPVLSRARVPGASI